MRWLVKDLARVHPTTRRFLTAATPEWKGDYMREAAESARGPGNYLAIALFSGTHLIGWAMLDILLSRQSSFLRTYVFVKPEYRRNGFGSMILARARRAVKRRGKRIRVCPHDKHSKKFFLAAGVVATEVAPGYNLYKR